MHSNDRAILPLHPDTPDTPPGVGGKARQLGRLARAGLPVPPGFVLTAVAFREARRAAGGRAGSLQVPAHLRDPIRDAARRLLASPPGAPRRRLVARSSAHGEDGEDRSFAGIYESYLSIATADDLLDRIERCWASLASDRAAAYRGGPPGADDYMAVIVQVQIEADHAGVAFTRDPMSDGTTSLIEVVAGQGEGLVDGTADAVQFRVERTEPYRATPLPGGHADPAPPPCWLASVQRLALQAESLLGGPQDVEWVETAGTVQIVQSRPVTGASPAVDTRRPAGYVRALDEPFTPFGQWLEMEKAPRYAAALRHIKGPGFTWSVRFVSGHLHLRERTTPGGRIWELLAAPLFWAGQADILASYKASVAGYHARLAAVAAAAAGTDDPAELLARLQAAVDTYLWFAGSASIDAGHVANLLSGLLARLARWIAPADAAAARDLLLGSRSIIDERDEQLWAAVHRDTPDARRIALARWDARFAYFWADRNAKDPGWDIDTGRRERFIEQFSRGAVAPGDRARARARRAAAARARIERVLSARRPAWIRPLLHALFRLLLSQARTFFPLREDRNHEFYSGVMVIRTILQRLGASLHAWGKLPSASEVSTLSGPELEHLVSPDGTAVTRRTVPPPAPAVPTTPPPGAPGGDDHPLRGIPASGGVVEGVARVVTSWDAHSTPENGEILVCSAIRPYLTPLLLLAGALVTDRGSALSHGANLAREYGIPAVIATGDATARIRSGDVIRVDGDRGEVVRIGTAR
ncbi:MAG: PEP/pyruvate-binding domain-containing protein [Acidobacteriota bacterium]